MSNTIDPKYIVKLHGKDHVTYEGLLAMATGEGLESLEVNVIQFPRKENDNTCVCIATAKCKGKVFTDIGDANPGNVNSMIAKHIIRMASTRAKARALRDMLNIGVCAVEELEDINVEHGGIQNTQGSSKAKLATDKQKSYYRKLGKEKGLSDNDLKLIIEKTIGRFDNLTVDEMSKCIEVVRKIGA